MTDPKHAALDWIRQSLAQQFTRRGLAVTPAGLREAARQIHDKAAAHEVPVEECISWIHSAEFTPERSDWFADWAHHCADYSEFQKRYCGPKS